MVSYTTDEIRGALRPIASLLSKSEKAQQRVSPGTWQHVMLRNNIQALRIALSLIEADSTIAKVLDPGELTGALSALETMIGTSENAQEKFAAGTSQHTLLQNRIKALKIAKRLIKIELDGAND